MKTLIFLLLTLCALGAQTVQRSISDSLNDSTRTNPKFHSLYVAAGGCRGCTGGNADSLLIGRIVSDSLHNPTLGKPSFKTLNVTNRIIAGNASIAGGNTFFDSIGDAVVATGNLTWTTTGKIVDDDTIKTQRSFIGSANLGPVAEFNGLDIATQPWVLDSMFLEAFNAEGFPNINQSCGLESGGGGAPFYVCIPEVGSSDTIPMTDAIAADLSSLNNWNLNPAGCNLYMEGTSIERGFSIGGAQLPNGGLAGNYFDLLSKSSWGSGCTSYNDAVDGSTIAQDSARYFTGNSVYGVTVPSAHSLSPAVTGDTTHPHYYFLSMNNVLNSSNTAGISFTQCLASLTGLIKTIQADRWRVFLMTATSVVMSNDTATQTIIKMNQYARDKKIPYNYLIDAATWITNPLDTSLFQNDGVHPTATGDSVLGANFVTCMISKGCKNDFGLGYIQTNVSIFNPYINTPTLALNSIFPNAPTQLSIQSTGGVWGIGAGGSGGGPFPAALYIYDQTSGLLDLSIDHSQNITVNGTFQGVIGQFSNKLTVTGNIVSQTGNVGVGLSGPNAPITVQKNGFDPTIGIRWLALLTDSVANKGIGIGYDPTGQYAMFSCGTNGPNCGYKFKTYNGTFADRDSIAPNGDFHTAGTIYIAPPTGTHYSFACINQSNGQLVTSSTRCDSL